MRLIDADALDSKLDALAKRYAEQGRFEVAEDYSFVQTVLLTAPAIEAAPVKRGCPYCCDNGEGGHGRLRHSYDDCDGMAMSIHPSEKRKDGTRSLAWWATVHFRGECRDFYIECCPFCGRRLVPLKEEYDNAGPNCGAKMDGGADNDPS